MDNTTKNVPVSTIILFMDGSLLMIFLIWLIGRFGDVSIKPRRAFLIVWWFVCFILCLFWQGFKYTNRWCHHYGTVCGYAALACFVLSTILTLIPKCRKWRFTFACSCTTPLLLSVWLATFFDKI